ncbi:hypothetical protein IFHNHDMJ_01595 [Synechococcus sp. CBW1107]|nr:hypothetical protein IFHNHDMJ_01595 [Synechococcus sp. CBW1107]
MRHIAGLLLSLLTVALPLLLLPLPVPLALAPQALMPQALAEPGLCIGPVCADQITRSAKHHFQLRLRVSDQQGHHERLVVDCRDGRLSPATGPVERGYVAAVTRRACRLSGEPIG